MLYSSYRKESVAGVAGSQNSGETTFDEIEHWERIESHWCSARSFALVDEAPVEVGMLVLRRMHQSLNEDRRSLKTGLGQAEAVGRQVYNFLAAGSNLVSMGDDQYCKACAHPCYHCLSTVACLGPVVRSRTHRHIPGIHH